MELIVAHRTSALTLELKAFVSGLKTNYFPLIGMNHFLSLLPALFHHPHRLSVNKICH